MKNYTLKTLLTIVLLTFTLSGNIVAAHEDDGLEFFHPVTITKGKPLNIMDCVSLAYQNSPKIKRQKYYLDIAKSDVGIARSGYFPVISAGVGFYNENNSNSVYYDKHYRDLPSVGVSINKMVWDFGKTTAYIKMEEFYKIGAEYEFMDSLCATLFDVKWKYYNLLKAKALMDIAKKDEFLAERILTMTTKSPDKETALVYKTRATIAYNEAVDNFKNAKVDLDNAMYLINPQDYTIESTDTYKFDVNSFDWNFKPSVFKFTRTEAPSIAYKNSPDLHVLIATRKAMEQSLKYVRRTYLPDLTAGVGYGYNNTLEASNNSLQVSVGLNSSVNLMELKHSIKKADAQLDLAQNEIDLFKRDLYYEIQRAFNKVEKCESQVPLAQKNIKQAEKMMEIINKKYDDGALDYTTINDARYDYIKATTEYAMCLYEYNIALIQAEMAMHCHLVDIHNKSGHAVHHHSEELISNLIKALECTKEPKQKSKIKLFSKETSIDSDEDL